MNIHAPPAAAERPDPMTRLTEAEKSRVAWLEENFSRETVLDELKANLQTAVEIELATIPIYLFTYYSIDRTAASGENIDRADAFANKAGAVIMSVAVEEMLHMSLSANVLFALGVEPQLYAKAPKAYPTPLPYHKPKGPRGPDGQTAVLIPLAKLSFEQLWHFLQIEYPEQWDTPPLDPDWTTIGQFYSYIRCLLNTKFVTDADFWQGAAAQAIQPYNYSPNNIDTIYPTGKFDKWKPAPPGPMPAWASADRYPGGAEVAVFTDRDDSHAGKSQLLSIRNRDDALCAIDTICDQGEGYPVPNLGPGADDDQSKGEESHYVKFMRLQAQYADYAKTRETLPAQPRPVAPQLPAVSDAELTAAGLVVNFPENPTAFSYPEEYRPVADFCSACFQYMLIMSETVYRVPPGDQKLFFNEGLHRSMIWVLDKYVRTIRQIPVGVDASGKTLFMAPVFENFADLPGEDPSNREPFLGPRAASFTGPLGLIARGARAIEAANQLLADPGLGKSVADALNAVIHYVCVATPQPNSTAPPGSRPLPDVGRYWGADPAPGPAAKRN